MTCIGWRDRASSSLCLAGKGQRFRFSHVLLREAAYASVIEARRAELHFRTAEVLAKDERASDEPQRLSPGTTLLRETSRRHSHGGSGRARGLPRWPRRGQLSTISVRRSLPCGRTQAGSPQEEVAVLRLLGAQLVSLKGNAAPEAVDAFRRSRPVS